MDTPRRAFRPEVVGALEGRLALSGVAAAVNPHAIERAIEHGPLTQPVVTVTLAGSSQAQVLTHSGRPQGHQLTFSAHALNVVIPKQAVTIPVTIKVDYHNESKTAITSATIVDKLGPNITFVPGSVHTPPGSQLAVTTTANGSQVVQLNLPGGIAPGAEGYLEFQAEYHVS